MFAVRLRCVPGDPVVCRAATTAGGDLLPLSYDPKAVLELAPTLWIFELELTVLPNSALN